MCGISPNFFLAGAPKAGTTSLYHYLAQHPQIFMSPVKEPCFFASEVRPENFADPSDWQPADHLPTTWGAYLELFREADHQPAVGEGSVCYLWSASAPANIAARIPHARIVLVLRDPADRTFSQYLHGVHKGRIHSDFRSYLDQSLKYTSRLFTPIYPVLALGDYAEQIRRYLAHFAAPQIYIALYED